MPVGQTLFAASYVPTRADFVEARKHLFRRKPLMFAITVAMQIVGFVIILGIALEIWRHPSTWPNYIAGLLIGTYGFFNRSIAIRVGLRGNSDIGSSYRSELGDEAIHFEGPRSTLEFKWSGMKAFKESKNLFLMFMPNCLYAMVPKRAFPADELPQVREFLRTHVGRS